MAARRLMVEVISAGLDAESKPSGSTSMVELYVVFQEGDNG